MAFKLSAISDYFRRRAGVDLENSLFVIAPYQFHGLWVFDDARVGLFQEPFVAGADTIIDRLTQDIPNAATGFKLVFSSQAFPGYTACFVWDRPDLDGNWYVWPERNIEGWLCPALFKYFKRASKKLYVGVSAK